MVNPPPIPKINPPSVDSIQNLIIIVEYTYYKKLIKKRLTKIT